MIICGVKLTHDGAVALIDDGRLVFSVEMEKLNDAHRHSKVDDLAVVFDLIAEHGYSISQIDEFVFDGWRRTEKVRQLHGQNVTIGLAPYVDGIRPSHCLQRYDGQLFDIGYSSFYHYTTHAVGSYCASPFAGARESSWVMVWDGAMFPNLYHADAVTNSIYRVGNLCLLLGNAYHEMALRVPPFDTGIEFPGTLAVPGKMMALIARGEVRAELVDIFAAAFRRACTEVVDPRRTESHGYLEETLGQQIISRLLDRRLDVSAHTPEDVLASWHQFIFEELIGALRTQISTNGLRAKNLVFCGGCALNIKWNRGLRESGDFERVWIPPFPNDAGSALGAAASGWVSKVGIKPLEWSVYSGPNLILHGAQPGWWGQPCTPEEVGTLLAETGEPVIVLHGRAELGPRALGNRSIFASATSPAMKLHLNLIKRREDYRPVAPICLEDFAPEVFEIAEPDPYMVFECNVRPAWRDRVPAIVHEDGTARVQTVSETQNPTAHRILTQYYRLTGIPLLCNTSANSSGKGFFASDKSAMVWGNVNYVWAAGTLYSRRKKIPVPGLAACVNG